MSVLVFYGEDYLKLDNAVLLYKSGGSENAGGPGRAKAKESYYFDEGVELATLREKLQNIDFFSEKRLFIFKNIFQNQLSRGVFSKKITQILDFLKQWEPDDLLFVESDSNKVKYYKKVFPKATYEEYKLPSTLFVFLDGLYPGNFSRVYSLYQQTLKSVAVELLSFMVKRRIKELLAISTNSLKGNYQPWQLGKLKSQAKMWKEDSLVATYSGLYKMEKGIKTGMSPLDMQRSLEILLGFSL